MRHFPASQTYYNKNLILLHGFFLRSCFCGRAPRRMLVGEAGRGAFRPPACKAELRSLQTATVKYRTAHFNPKNCCDLLDVPWALYTRLQHATLRFVLLCYLCATFYCAAYETRLPKPVINRSLSLPSTTQQQIFQYFQPVRRPMQEYVLSISIFKQPRPLSSRIASPAGITLVLHRASSLGNI